MNDEPPPILKKPMTLTIDLLWAAIFTEWGGTKAIRNNEDLQSAVDNFFSQLNERIAAACSHFGIVPGELDANLWPVVSLIFHAFPDAFRVVQQGYPRKPRKNGNVWSVKEKLLLVNYVDARVEAGATQAQACAMYGELSICRKTNVVQRYHDARKWLKKPAQWTTFEKMELLKLLHYENQNTD